MIKFPYARRDFYEVITEEYLYLDRTHHITFVENWGKEILFMRPRRFGKSLWLSTLMNYYDIHKADEFERLFGHLAIGREPTPNHSRYLVMKWDFSRIAVQGEVDGVHDALNQHINDRIQRFSAQYGKQLSRAIEINEKTALSSLESLMTAVDLSGQKLYLFIDEYDNFANEIVMQRRRFGDEDNYERYSSLVKGEGLFKTLFKNLKSAGSGDGLDRIFMTGVSPIVLNDVTSGANIFTDISWHPKVNELCGFTAAEVRKLVQQVVETCGLSDAYVDEAMAMMHDYYNGSRFIEDYSGATKSPKVYNPTLAFYFLQNFQDKCSYPKYLIDQNVVPDDNKFAYLTNFGAGKMLLRDALGGQKTISVETLSHKFGVRDLLEPSLQQEHLAILLCYLGGLTSTGELLDGQITLEIPNLAMRRLYGQAVLEEMVDDDTTKIEAGRNALNDFLLSGSLQPLCTFVEENLLPIYDNRDAKSFNELTLKTLFITFLYQNQMYLIDSEPEIERQYGDLIMMVRAGMRERGLKDILIEFKHLPLNKVTEDRNGRPQTLSGEEIKAKSEQALRALPAVQEQFTEAKKQLQSYRQKLIKKYRDDLNLHTYAVVSVGFDRILWVEVDGEV